MECIWALVRDLDRVHVGDESEGGWLGPTLGVGDEPREGFRLAPSVPDHAVARPDGKATDLERAAEMMRVKAEPG
jgi:hypothetical protein